VDESRGLCPEGWHVPTIDEWIILVDFAGGSEVAGAKLKEVGNDHWFSNSGSTNEYGFSAYGGGFRNDDGSFSYIKADGKWWSSTESSSSSYNGRFVSMDQISYYVRTTTIDSKKNGFSIRCLKD
jgi:uncharacterized protein (TIGR02145 family)